jgi:spore coat polysaccharide biosynthesis protein SpsF
MTAAIIQARLASQRLPGKILMEIAGKPMLQHVIDHAKAIPGVERVIVAVPVTEMDYIQQVIRSDVWWWGGSDTDVLERYYDAAKMYNVDPVMRLTADCPLLDSKACQRVIDVFYSAPAERPLDYASNIHPETDGLDTEVFSFDALTRAHLGATDPYDREHVTPWMRRYLRCLNFKEPSLDAKTSVDTEEELERVRAVVTA